MSDVGVRALGPLEVWLDGQPVSLGGPKQRALLAFLVVNLNQVVPVGTIVEALWADDPPDSAVGQIQTGMWRLRRLLTRTPVTRTPGRADHGHDLRLETRPGGYLLGLDAARVDVAVFRDGISRGQTFLRASRYEEAARSLQQALALWRGRPFGDVPVPFAQAEAARLEEQRLIALEDRIETDLALGHHRELVPELRSLVGLHPLRDRLRAQLMLALYRSGRQAEALDTYRDAYELLTTELGLVPSPQLQTVHQAVLIGHTAPAVTGVVEPSARGGVDELPADVIDFTGRRQQVARAATALSGDASTTGDHSSVPTRRVVAVSGPPGVGKTAFAVRVAHLLRPHFPDGRLYIDLHGLADQPLPAGEALNRLLRWCAGSAVTPPDDIEERAALVRSHLAERRVLLVLDNAQSEAQVRPLVPDAPGCAVLLTSRRQLAALDNLLGFDLAVFEPEEAVELIATLARPDRVAADPAAAAELARLCGYLPLAIRIVGARLWSRPHWSLRRMADRLVDERRRLDALSIGDRGVRGSIALSYAALEPTVRRLFRLFGTLTETDAPAWVAAALLDQPEPEAEALLEELVDARLIEIQGPTAQSADRYGMHSLVRLYARERCAEEEPGAELLAAAERMAGGWLYLAELAEPQVPGGLPRIAAGRTPRWTVSPGVATEARERGMDWFATEQSALVSAVHTACTRGLDEVVWDLVGCLGRFLEVRGDIDRWLDVLQRALTVAEAAGNRRGQAYLLRGLAEVWLNRDRYPESLECLGRALEIFDELDETLAKAHAERAVGVLERMRGDGGAAALRFGRALAVFEEADDRVGMADTLFSLGALHRDQGAVDEALACYQRALRLEQELGNRFNEALLLCSIGAVLILQERIGEARATLTQSLEAAREIRQESAEAYALCFLGEADLLAGDIDAAALHLDVALTMFQQQTDRYGEAITWRNLGDLHRLRSDLALAGEAIDRSLALWDQLGAPLWRGRTLLTLGRVCLARGDVGAARDAWRAAEELLNAHPTIEREQARQLLRDSAQSDRRAES
ncbi:BTAD domain-containing putative transcriptional regulator [Phytohabitans suffuscus]